MSDGVWLGVDPGAVRVGVAISDPSGRIAVPVDTLRRDKKVVGELVALAAERHATAIVVGLPRSLSGAEGPAAERARAFARELAATVTIPVRLVDERMSTVSATSSLRASGHDSRSSREVVDQVAATVILQSALDVRERCGDDVGELVEPTESAR